MFGAQLAAALGLPYAFASHFAPHALLEAVAVYRREFQPSAQLERPYVIAADTTAAAHQQLLEAKRRRAKLLLGRGRRLSAAEADAILAAPSGLQVLEMVRYAAVGPPGEVTDHLARFTEHADADELILPDRRSD